MKTILWSEIFRPLLFSFAIIIGIFLASDEYAASNSIHNFFIFFFASLLIYVFEVLSLRIQFKKNTFDFSEEDFYGKSSIYFHIYFLPLVNITLVLLLGLSEIRTISIFITLLIATLVLFLHFKFIANYLSQTKKTSIATGYGPDFQKLLFIFLFTQIIYLASQQEKLNNIQIAYFSLLALSVFLLTISIHFYRRNKPFDIFFNAITASYIITASLISIAVVVEPKPALLVSLVITLIFYTLIALIETFYEKKEISSSILVRYVVMVILAAGILFLV